MTSVFQLGLVSLILPVSWSAPENSAKSTFLTVIILKHPVQSKYMAERISPTPRLQVRALNGISRWVFKARKAYNIRNFTEKENVMGISAASSVQEYIWLQYSMSDCQVSRGHLTVHGNRSIARHVLPYQESILHSLQERSIMAYHRRKVRLVRETRYLQSDVSL